MSPRLNRLRSKNDADPTRGPEARTNDGKACSSGSGQATLFLAGVTLTLASWIAAWTKIPILSQHAFFPLWISYTALLNGLCEYCYNDSLLKKLKFSFLWLFVLSIPFWWFFELLNLAVENWHYVFPAPITQLEFAIKSSINFSTVLPAVMSTIYLFKSAIDGFGMSFRGRSFAVGKRWLAVSVLFGLLGLDALTLLPDITFPLVWIAPLLIIEPISYLFGFPSLLRKTQDGNYNLIVSIALATSLDGFLWELWNFYSMPKWVYTIPCVGFWKFFEMPALGYLGYPFFGLIVYSFTVLVVSLLNERGAGKLTPEPAGNG